MNPTKPDYAYRAGQRMALSCLFFLHVFLLFPAQAGAQVKPELWYKTPAAGWNEALPAGNGRIGAMVCGRWDTEHIFLNEESLWAGSKQNNNNKLALRNLPAIRKALFEGEYERAWHLSDTFLLGTPPRIRSYQPLGDLRITYPFSGEPERYRRVLSLDSGIVRSGAVFAGNAVSQEVFASAPHDVILISIRTGKPMDTGIFLSRIKDVDQYRTDGKTAWFRGQIRDAPSPLTGPGGNHMRFATAMRVLFTDGMVEPVSGDSSAGYQVKGCTRLVIALTGATDYDAARLDCDPGRDPLGECVKKLEAAAAFSFETLKEVHVRDHRALFNRVHLELGPGGREALPANERLAKVKAGDDDPGLAALYYQYGRYLLMASSRKPGRLPANLQGIWNRDTAAKWNSDFHTNINLQMNYWPAESGNLPETTELLAAFLEKLAVPGALTAREMYGARGWTLHHLTDVFGRTGVADGVWGVSPLAGPWMTFSLAEHYLFTGDTSFLRKTAYPLLRGAVLFVLDFLTESPEGFLVTNPSHSPENSFYIPGSNPKKKAYLSYGATVDGHIINGLFDYFTEAAGILGKDASLVGEIRNVRKRLPPLRVAPNGTLQEWIKDYEEAEPGHRHISHLLGLYPLNLITPSDSALFRAAAGTVARRRSFSSKYVGWSSAWMINFYARLLDGEKAGEQVQQLLRYSTLNSLLNTIPPFQIDGNLGGSAGIAEMLLQSQNSEIHLLPALPAAWSEGKADGLRARGGYTVTMEWKRQRLVRLALFADRQGTCRIRYRGNVTTVYLKKGPNELTAVLPGI